MKLNPAGTYLSETTWNNSIGASGGGISTVWPIPSYQTALVDASSDAELSHTQRNVPDVSLDADPETGYSIFVSPVGVPTEAGWQEVGGTSAAAPLWARFTALINQERAANGVSTLGFANPTLYTIAASTNYATEFHDIADNSTNLFYHAMTGFDDATGLGSFNGASLAVVPADVRFRFHSDHHRHGDFVVQQPSVGRDRYHFRAGNGHGGEDHHHGFQWELLRGLSAQRRGARSGFRPGVPCKPGSRDRDRSRTARS